MYSISVKQLGLIDQFNGMDIEQTKYYINIHCGSYINHLLIGHNWLNSDQTLIPHIPMCSDNAYICELDNEFPPKNNVIFMTK